MNIFVLITKRYLFMKKLLSTFLFLSIAFIVTSQTIRYDTIRVPVDDERNIHRASQQGQKVMNPSQSKLKATNRSDNINTSSLGIDKSKIRYGANLGLSLSRNYTSINIGPQIGYQASNWAMIGVGVKYNYNKVRGYRYNNSYLYKNHLIGANAFGYLYPVRFITIFAQPEINYMWSNYTNEETGIEDHTNGAVPSFVVGGGLRFGRSHITLNYDLVQHVNSPYSRGVFLGISVFM